MPREAGDRFSRALPLPIPESSWIDSRTGKPEVRFQRSDNGGATRLAQDIALAPEGEVDGSNGLEIAAEGDAMFLVEADDREGNADICFQRSLDHGAS